MTGSAALGRQRVVRLLPALLLAATLLLAVRLGELSLGLEFAAAGPAHAQTVDAPSQEAGEATAASEAGEGAAAAPLVPAPEQRSIDLAVEFTPAEIAVLQDLASRREALAAREQELEARARLLDAAEARLDERIAELQQLKSSIEALVRQYDENEQAELKSVVKIYESMKPKDAARILEDLDMHILLGIMEHMNGRKTAPILAEMEPKRAREVTAEIARKREVDLLEATH